MMRAAIWGHQRRGPPIVALLSPLWLAFCLLLEHVTAQGKSAADYYVKSLPGQPAGSLLKMHAG